MTTLYPLRLQPILRRHLWGGRRFETVFGRPLGPGNDYAESWEVCDRRCEQTGVASGPLSGTPLHDLVEQRAADLLGRHQGVDRFPLLLKFLDAQRRLSVQVHPDDLLAARANPPDRGKSEAWVVLAAEPGATIYAGLKPGVDRAQLARAIQNGTCDECLHRFQPRVGDCVYIPAGTVHALGEGLLIYEIQQASDITYRLFDWNRLGPDGQPRPLHIAEALQATDYARGPVSARSPEVLDSGGQRLVTCEHFVLDRWDLKLPAQIGRDSTCHLLTVLSGAVTVPGDTAGRSLRSGETIFVPAAMGPLTIAPVESAVVLDASLP